MGGKYRIKGDTYPRMRRPRRRGRLVLALVGAIVALGLIGWGTIQLIDVFGGGGKAKAAAHQKDCPRPAPRAPPGAAQARADHRQRLQRDPARGPGQDGRRRAEEARLRDRQGRQRARGVRQEGPGQRDTARRPGGRRRPLLRTGRTAQGRNAEDRHAQHAGHRSDSGHDVRRPEHAEGRGHGPGRSGQARTRALGEVLRTL